MRARVGFRVRIRLEGEKSSSQTYRSAARRTIEGKAATTLELTGPK